MHSQTTPLVDYHQHLFSPAIVALASVTPAPAARRLSPISASDLVAKLDSAGIRRGLVLSVAYMYGNPNRPPVENEYAKVKAENDWTSQQVARFPDRLRAFCGFNPLKEYALDELARCAKDPQLRAGLKLHFGNSDVDLDNPQHVAQLLRVFGAANELRMPIVVHLRSSVTKQRPWGRQEARIFLDEVLPSAPDIAIQIAHLAGAGSYDDPTDHAVAVFADAIAKRDPRMRRVYFDVSGIDADTPVAMRGLMARRIRQLGVGRVLYGTDAASSSSLASRQGWAAFRQVPLSDAEFRTIANNVTPYMR
jgi:predicted TIM-barrel fold metal-dependent hydrolase